MTNSQAAVHKICLDKYFPHALGSSQSNFLKYSQEQGYVSTILPPAGPKPSSNHSTSVTDKHRFSEIDIMPAATTIITPTTTTTNSPTKILALISISTSVPPRIRMPSSRTFSITMPLSSSIPLLPSSPVR